MENIDLVSLYQFDEIYFISELSGPSEVSGPSEKSDQSDQSDSVKAKGLEVNSPERISGEQEKNIGNEEWLILGIEADRKSVQSIFTSPPFSFPSEKFYFQEAQSWSIEEIRNFVKQSSATRMIFLGQHYEFLKLNSDPIEKGNKWYLYFPQTLSSLTDTDKQTKILFWNQLKKML